MTAYKGKTEPRIYTPPLRELTEETSLGYAYIKFAKNVLNLSLYPWQEWLAVHSLEIVGDLHGEWRFRFRNVLAIMGRQNGKTYQLEGITLFFMYVLKVPLVLGTAQNLSNSERIMEETLALARNTELLAPYIEREVRANGAKGFITTDSEYVCRAATPEAARSLSVDLAILDELCLHRSDEAWGAITKTTMSRPNAQIWAITSAGDTRSVVLNKLRIAAHKALGDPDNICDNESALDVVEQVNTDGIGIFEWSAPPGADILDRNAWAQANPSLGYGLLTERAIETSLATDGERVFRQEILAQWVEARNAHPFGLDKWQAAIDEASSIYGKPYFGIDVSQNRDYTAISVLGERKDGMLHTEVVEYRLGVGWALEWLRKRVEQYPEMTVALQGRGAVVSAYLKDLQDIEGLKVVPIQNSDLTTSFAKWHDGILANTQDNGVQAIKHIDQEVLNIAVDGAVKKVMNDGAFMWNRNMSQADISPLIACSMAYGAYMLDKDNKSYGIMHPSAIEARSGEVFTI